MRRHGRAHGAAVVLAVAAAVLCLSGCFKARQDVKIRGDGSGSVVLHAELNKKAMAAVAKSFGGATTSPLGTMTGSINPVDKTFPDGTRVRAVEDADKATFDASFSFNGPDEYARKMQQVDEALSGNPDASLREAGSIRVSRNGDVIEVALDVGSTAGTGNPDISALFGVLDRDAIPEVIVTLTMPGSIVDSNGTNRGRTVTWDLLRPGAPPLLTASSKVARPALPAWAVPAGVALILVLLLGVVGAVLSRRRPKGDPAVAYHPGPWSPGGQQAPGTFFPIPGGLPPREPVGWPSPPPAAPPVTAPVQVPPAPWPGASDAAQPPADAAAGEPAGSPRATAAEPPGEDPLPWRLPGAAAEPGPGGGGTAGGAAGEEEPPTAAPVLAPEAGWYADPAGGSGVRWWDGAQWTGHTR